MDKDEFFENWLAQHTKERIEKDNKNAEIYCTLQSSLLIAEAKHPVFATSFEEGMMRVLEEAGEVAQASNKGAGEKRKGEELMDLLCVVWRMVRGDFDER